MRSEYAYCGLGRAAHCRQLSDILHLSFEWHSFSEKAITAFSENREIAICGGGGTAKSTSAGLYGFFFWLCGIECTAVLPISTSIDAASRRIWANISKYYSEACKVLGGGIEDSVMLGRPKPHVRTFQKDWMHGIFVIPVALGELQKGINSLKGFHPRRLLLIGDETDAISQAVPDVTANLQIGTEEFQAIWLGNLPSSFNPLGGIMEPAPGKTVTEACGKEWTSTSGVKCLRFDGTDSPNITDGNKWTGITRQEDIDAIVNKWTANSLHYWTMVKGLPAPAGVCNTVIAESLIVQFNCYDSVIWFRETVVSCLLDPAFGGDRCTIRLMKRGLEAETMKMRIMFSEPVIIPIDVASVVPPEYQILEFVSRFCGANGVRGDEFIIDGTGTGRGSAAVLQREWNPNILVCNFGGSATDRIVSEEDPRPASDIYDRFITELYFSFREFVQANMIRGLDKGTAKELCQREFDIKGKKMSVKTKAELKAHGFPSPDLADNAVLGTELLRRKGIFPSIQTSVKRESSRSWDREVEEQDFDAHDDTYLPDFEVEEY